MSLIIFRNKEGRTHRTDGPAIVWDHGNTSWWQNGLRHREDGPAIIENNTSLWLNDEGNPEENIDNEGYQEWWLNGKQHREDGPAIVYQDGYKAWCVNGRQYTEEEFSKLKFTQSNVHEN